MTAPIVVGVDAGTSGCKAVALSQQGTVVGTGWAGYSTSSTPDGGITQSPDSWVSAMETAARGALATVDPTTVEGISVTAPAYNAVLLGADGMPLSDVMLWSDPRPTGNAARLRDRHAQVLEQRSLVTLGPSHTVAQLHWMKQCRPDLIAATRRLMIGKDYLRHVLTGDHCADPGNLASTGMFDVRDGSWISELVAETGLDPAVLPLAVASFDTPGGVCSAWAARLGVRSGVPVAVGANDTSAELVSVGATAPGSGLVKIASTGTVVVVSDEPHHGHGMLTYPHVEPGCWYTLAATNTAGSALTWLVRNVFGDNGDSNDLERIEHLAGTVAPGSAGLLAFPWVAGERAALGDPDVRAAFIGAGMGHHQGHFARAVMEAAAYALADCRDVLSASGLSAGRPALTGGGLRSDLWRRIVLAVLGADAVVRTPCEPALGAAMIAAQSVGLDIESCATTERLTPDPSLTEVYRIHRARHRSLAANIAQLSRRQD